MGPPQFIVNLGCATWTEHEERKHEGNYNVNDGIDIKLNQHAGDVNMT
jgi:hypothetical protein